MIVTPSINQLSGYIAAEAESRKRPETKTDPFPPASSDPPCRGLRHTLTEIGTHASHIPLLNDIPQVSRVVLRPHSMGDVKRDPDESASDAEESEPEVAILLPFLCARMIREETLMEG